MLKQLFVESARSALPNYRQFEVEASNHGSRFIEAEHMLLAFAANTDGEAGRVLLDAGLDHERLTAALRAEHRQTLAFAGVKLADTRAAAMAQKGNLTLGTSAKAAIVRALHASREVGRRRRRLQDLDLLVGILGAELGTVPRALALAGVNRRELIARARMSVEEAAKRC